MSGQESERDLLIRVDTKLGILVSDYKEFKAKTDSRVTFLEKAFWIGIGGIAILQLIVQVLQ
ncbi:MAG: hypothetical protein FMNOHCHN_03656 [Ignavibacteriaceae bacterium]|nr:hypothetical protein [Ignavibacteriaceae bacterium]